MTPDADAPTFEPIRKRTWGRNDRSDFRFECDGKKEYKSRAEARSAVRGMKLSGEYVHDYKCAWCAYYHVGGSTVR
jgi:hypothetical protein